MPVSRVALVLIQAFANQLACTPPNPTPSKGRYHTDELYILQIAPFIFKCHQIIFWLCATFEVLYFLQPYIPLPSPLTPTLTSALVCPSNPNQSSDPIHVTPSFITGIISVVLGSYVRLDCFRALGRMFTFDLTIHPEHTLITNRFYAYVRHPAYTGSLLLVGGLTLSHLTKGSWLTECGPLTSSGSALVVWALWWLWTICVGVSRAHAEDRQMRKLFKDEWDVYAANVPWWFFPGII
ncbi:hypothetical protein P691DRAFT_348749 [Macrolepiota fuliginosa MF-IS2]|uniref:Protein-S-isoprenylcysteine O-methyltransferase n=1 Tax=Macrolepiota fuliginosa MF-IS2 TaxID=1400762 RepID=A0A9P5X4J0_9AGAR|nr:hypothetical protein P691DRAFT_348749 [Macrolepiota fuliginosa MF-IS2]